MIEFDSIRPLPKKPPQRVLGIDFGTTFCCIAEAFNSEDVRIIGPLIPSVIAYTDQGKPIVGHEALDGPWPIVRSIKRCLKSNDLFVGHTPMRIATDLFKGLKAHIIKYTDTFIAECVLSVPAYFDETQRQMIKHAAVAAGFNVLRLLSEPSAAALTFDLKEPGLYGVYDLGGGTFDFSLLKMQHGLFRVLATGGIADFGGDDLDRALALFMKKDDPTLQTARRLKETALTQKDIPVDVLETLFAPLLEHTVDICVQTLKEANTSPLDLKAILLVGGSTRLWLVPEILEKRLGYKPLSCLDPDCAVAMGAALHAYYLTHAGQFLLLDASPLSLGLETLGGFVQVMIARHTPLPARAEMIFATGADGQTGFELHVLQGEQELAKNMRRLGSFVLKNLPALPQGMVRVKIIFILDEDGLLTIKAQCITPQPGQEMVVELNPFHALTADDLEEQVEKAGEDFFERRLLESKNKATAMRQDIDRLFPCLPETLKKAYDHLQEKYEGNDPFALDQAIEVLGQVLVPFMEESLTAQLKKALEN